MKLKGHQLDAFNAAIKNGTAADVQAALQKTCEQVEGVGQLTLPSGSVTLTYQQLESLLKKCRWEIESAPGEDPPDGYEALPPEQSEIADECWHRGMEQLSSALLNYWYDEIRKKNQTKNPKIGYACAALGIGRSAQG